MKNLSRRQYLKLLSAGLTTNFISPSLSSRTLSHICPLDSNMPLIVNQGVLVVIFLRGGCDGINTLIPTKGINDSTTNLSSDWHVYKFHRPLTHLSETDFLSHGLKQSNYKLDNTPFSIHPAMHPLLDIIKNKKQFSFYPACHTNIDLENDVFGNTSHFSADEILESGAVGKSLADVRGVISACKLKPGWLSRTYKANPGNSINMFGFDAAHSISGDAAVLTMADISKGLAFNNEQKQLLLSSLTHAHDIDSMYCDDIDKKCITPEFINDLSRTVQIETFYKATRVKDALDNYISDVSFPSGKLGTNLRQSSALIKNIPELQVITIDDGGYDHHSQLKKSLNFKLGRLSLSLKAFHDDLSNSTKPVEVVIMTEFGRTVDENSAPTADRVGTDHGQAFTAMAMSAGALRPARSAVKFGKKNGYSGVWPGLEELVVKQNRRYYLNAMTDYRDVLREAVQNVHNMDIAAVFQQFDSRYLPEEFIA